MLNNIVLLGGAVVPTRGMRSQWYGARERGSLQGGCFGKGDWGRFMGGRHGDICDGHWGAAGRFCLP